MILESKGNIADGLFAVGEPGLPAFLLMGASPVLFDAGMTFMGPSYVKSIRALLGDEALLRHVFLTHAHFDHSGACPYLKRKIPGLKAGAHPLAAATFRKPNAVALIRSLSRDYEDRHAGQIAEEDVSFEVEGPHHRRSRRCLRREHDDPPRVSFQLRRLSGLARKAGRSGSGHAALGASFHADRTKRQGHMAQSIARTKIFRKRIEDGLHDLHGDREAVVQKIFREDYEGTGAILQAARPYRINLAAKVKAVADA
jgi:hypothetical protein